MADKTGTRKIYKYFLLQGNSKFTVEMPLGAKPLHVATQMDAPCLWAEVDPSAPIASREFLVAGTGAAFCPDEARYIGTAHVGPFVWHYYDVAEVYP